MGMIHDLSEEHKTYSKKKKIGCLSKEILNGQGMWYECVERSYEKYV
jgi:hypothetical protein